MEILRHATSQGGSDLGGFGEPTDPSWLNGEAVQNADNVAWYMSKRTGCQPTAVCYTGPWQVKLQSGF